MPETKDFCMETLPFQFIRRCPAGGIYRIPQKRMADGSHMNPYLVGTSRFQPAFHIRIAMEPFEHPDMGYGMFSVLFVYRHLLPVSGMPSDGGTDGSFVFFQYAVTDGMVMPDHGMVF